MLPPPQQSPLNMATIAAKLAASERDADAARVRAKLKAMRQTSGSRKRVSLAPPATGTDTSAVADASRSTRSEGGADGGAEQGGQEEDANLNSAKDDEEDELAPKPEDAKQQQLPRKRERRTSRVASRRRSTLNPWELGALIQGNVAVGTAPGEGAEEGR